MDQYVGLDVSLKQTWISVRQNRKRIWRGKCLSHPRAVADAIRQHAPNAVLVVFETGALATWFHHALTAEGLPAVCIDARHAKAALDTAPNKTDANDADGLALLAEAGFFREVRVKSWEAMPVRTLVGGRAQLIAISNDLSNQIRGIMKTFGLVVPKGGGRSFETNVRALLEGQAALAGSVLPLLEAWRAVRVQTAKLDRQLVAVARKSPACRLLMTVPGVGTITALSYTTMIEDPANFANSRAVGAFVGLTTRSYQSGEVDYDGHISRRGDKHVRALLYEAATVVLTRVRSDSALRRWGLKLKEKVGFKRAAVAVARKLAVILHALWRDGRVFDPAFGAPA
jgi:transposase